MHPSEYISTSHFAQKTAPFSIPSNEGPAARLRRQAFERQAVAENAAKRDLKSVADRADVKAWRSVTQDSYDGHGGISAGSSYAASNAGKGSGIPTGTNVGTERNWKARDVPYEGSRPLPDGDYSSSECITYWKEAVPNGSVVMTGPTCSNVFARSSRFTNDIRDGTKRHSEGEDWIGDRVGDVGETEELRRRAEMKSTKGIFPHW